MFDRLSTKTLQSATFGSVATNSSSLVPVGVLAGPHAIVGATILNNSTASVASGTTSGSAASIILYKTASGTASKAATFNSSGTSIATQATQAMTLSTSTALLRGAGIGSVTGYFAEFVGGAGNNASNAGLSVALHYVDGWQDGTTPSAATGPA